MKKQYWIYGGIAVGALAVIVLIAKHRKKLALTKYRDDLVTTGIGAKYAANNKKLLDALNPAERAHFVAFVNDIQKMGYAVVITSAYRNTASQIKQKKADSRNATPGFSSHEYGIALDINLIKGTKWINKDSSIDEWKKTGVVDLAKNKYGMRWGGEFPGYKDPVHFDEAKKYDVNKLYKLAIKKFGSPEKIEGNKLTLVT
jgi:hypothetical protein